MADFLPAFTEHGLPGLIVLLSFAFAILIIKRCLDFMDTTASRHENRLDAILESHRLERQAHSERLSKALDSLTAAIQNRRPHAVPPAQRHASKV